MRVEYQKQWKQKSGRWEPHWDIGIQKNYYSYKSDLLLSKHSISNRKCFG